MTIETIEENVLRNYERDIKKAYNKDSVNKLYRQARIWSRFHNVYAECCSDEHAFEIRKKLKEIRLNRLNELTNK